MRILKFLALAALSVSAVVAKKAPADPSKFDKYLSKQSSRPLEIDEAVYDELTAVPRDYSLAVLLTARAAKFACQTCKAFDPEWDIVGRSWAKGDPKGKTRVLLTTLDFDQGRNVFMKLQLATAPVLLLFPPTAGPNAKASANEPPRRLEFIGAQSAESVRNWLVRHLPEEASDYPAIHRPVNYGRIVSVITILIGLFTVGTVVYPYVLPIVQNRNLWAALSLILVLLFTSGHMFNHIRKVPYVTGDGRGGISYFAGGFQNQVGMETQIVAGIYALLSFATISLSLKAPRIKDKRTQQLAIIIWASVMWGVYSFLLSVFRVKNGGYPFWLPPF
ncbi:hypothetical protein DV735_g5583, partial [Chaetothyriales sp. CBS 134920]